MLGYPVMAEYPSPTIAGKAEKVAMEIALQLTEDNWDEACDIVYRARGNMSLNY